MSGAQVRYCRAVNPSTDWREQIAPDEDKQFLEFAERLRAQQRKVAGNSAARRALHAKGLGLAATFTVLPDLPEHARAGLFETPATYRAYVRFSNGSARTQHDKLPDVRGAVLTALRGLVADGSVSKTGKGLYAAA